MKATLTLLDSLWPLRSYRLCPGLHAFGGCSVEFDPTGSSGLTKAQPRGSAATRADNTHRLLRPKRPPSPHVDYTTSGEETVAAATYIAEQVRDSGVYLLNLDHGEGQIADTERSILFPPTNRAAIIASATGTRCPA